MVSYNKRVFLLVIFLMSVVKGVTPRVVIVGAGASGIASASRLLANNITDITILEAENRIGGRIHSVKFGNALVDLGAEWCHGHNNIVYKLLDDINVLVPSLMKNVYYSSNNDIDQTFAGQLKHIFNELFAENKGSEGLTMGDYITKKYTEKITVLYKDDMEKFNFASKFLDVLKRNVLLLQGTFTWFDSSAKYDYIECDGNKALSWNGQGHQTLLNVLIKSQPSIIDKIKFNKEVTNIHWGDKVSIKCLDDSTYTADHVIVTTSLGVLKDRHGTLFNPPLPQYKINAIETLGIEAVLKVFCHFPTRWWTDDNFRATFVWNDQTSLEMSLLDKPNLSWLSDVSVLHHVEKNPNVLEAWIVGNNVPMVEMLDENEITDGIMMVLNTFLGDKFPNITRPDAIVYHQWYNNPHFRGTYSFQTISSRKLDASPETILSQPLYGNNGGPSVMFAGEATHAVYYGTVHGAVETGFREADRIIDFYR